MTGRKGGIGIIASREDDIIKGYARALNTRLVIYDEGLDKNDWRTYYAWSLRSRYDIPMRAILCASPDAAWCLEYVKERARVKFVAGLNLYDEIPPDGLDRVFEPVDLGWGCDKKRFVATIRTRPLRTRPVFYMTERCQWLSDSIKSLGYDVFEEDGYNKYANGDIAVVPSRCAVPVDAYAAAASGMPIVTISDNAKWFSDIGFANLDEGPERVIAQAANSDYRLAGLIASENIPGLSDFSSNIRSVILTYIGN